MLTKNDKILFVDDEVNLLNSIKRNLIAHPFASFFATSGEKALSIMQRQEIKVIVSDLQMPGMNGIELLEQVEREQPEMVKIVLTGNSQVPNILAAINKVNIYKYMIKPWKFQEEFIPSIYEAFEIYNLNKRKAEMLKIGDGINDKGLLDVEYLKSLQELLGKMSEHINIIQSISRKLPFMNKELLDKLSVDIYTRTGIILGDMGLLKLILKSIEEKKGDKNENTIY